MYNYFRKVFQFLFPFESNWSINLIIFFIDSFQTVGKIFKQFTKWVGAVMASYFSETMSELQSVSSSFWSHCVLYCTRASHCTFTSLSVRWFQLDENYHYTGKLTFSFGNVPVCLTGYDYIAFFIFLLYVITSYMTLWYGYACWNLTSNLIHYHLH